MVSLAGLAGGLVFGLAARMARFCMMGAVEDAVYGSDFRRARMIAMAAGVAIACSALLIEAGGLDPSTTPYLGRAWSPLAAVLGGVVFGYGMALVGTCAFGALARVGGGDIRALVMVLVIGVTAYATLHGPFSGVRQLLLPTGEGPMSLAEIASARLGVAPLGAALAIALALCAFGLWGQAPHARRVALAWGAAIGLVIASAWATTSWAAGHGFDVVAVEAFNFVAPIGETLMHLMTVGQPVAPGFSVAAVIGVIAGAAAGSGLRGEFRWEACDDARELRRQIFGAMCMGIGGIVALGCTIGQGLSALSLLTPSAPVVIFSIFLGARLGLLVLVEGLPGRRR